MPPEEDPACKCAECYMTPWATVIAMFGLYLVALLWFCRHGKKICLPTPDSIYRYKSRLKYLKRVLNHLLVDDMFIELTDSKLGQGAVGFVFKGYVFPKTQTPFKQKTSAAVKMSYPMPQKSIGLLEEAARMARLNHPNIVRLIAVSKLSFTAFRPMFAMEWLPGGSLAEFFRDEIQVWRREGRDCERVLVGDIVHVLRQVGEALKYLHEHRDPAGNEFTHGDVAARNVLLNQKNLSNCVAKTGRFRPPDRLRAPPADPLAAAGDRLFVESHSSTGKRCVDVWSSRVGMRNARSRPAFPANTRRNPAVLPIVRSGARLSALMPTGILATGDGLPVRTAPTAPIRGTNGHGHFGHLPPRVVANAVPALRSTIPHGRECLQLHV
ncbi:Ephrin type-B receptor 1 [Aphelenchoides fujianensis]|nr:Ephrin type-B receptor 1 [Aphelenchoides fujianensis]